MTIVNLVQRGWEIFAMGVFGLVVSAAQIVTGKAMVWRRGKLLPDWEFREGYPGYFIWGVVSTGAFGALSVWYGISEVLKHSN
jgi:hypothetical protein